MAVKINFDQKVKFWRFVHHEASSVNIDRMSGDYNQAVQKLIKPKPKDTDDGIAEEQVSRDFESLYPENYTEADVNRIRKRAELIQTVQGMKNLAYDNNILFWFSNHGQGLSDRSLVVSVTPGDTSRVAKQQAPTTRPGSPNRSKNLGNFTLQPMAITQTQEAVLVAWAKLDMNGVDSSDAIEAFISSVQTPSMASVVVPNKSRNSVNLDSTEKPKGQRSANHFKTFESKGKYFLKIHAGHNPEDEIVEVLFFESRDKLEEWREWMAKVPVCFLDLKHRYEFIQHRGRDGPYRIVDLRCRFTMRAEEPEAIYQGRIVDCSSCYGSLSIDYALVQKAVQNILREVRVLKALHEHKCAPEFIEIQREGSKFWVLTSSLSGERFSEWFERYVMKDFYACQMMLPILKLIRGLIDMVARLAKSRVAHMDISKQKIFVEVCKCLRCARKGATNMVLDMVSEISPTERKCISPTISQRGVKINTTARNISLHGTGSDGPRSPPKDKVFEFSNSLLKTGQNEIDSPSLAQDHPERRTRDALPGTVLDFRDGSSGSRSVDHPPWWFRLSGFHSAAESTSDSPMSTLSAEHWNTPNSLGNVTRKGSADPSNQYRIRPSFGHEDVLSIGKIIYEM